ncbi:RelA/SpoT family protein [Clostridium cellulovorans]|uniref:GTP diphosphokinase n=1 Tax=Clostridium cellulovorans (strain ATCC 35296 / DSM 3052 / OCM 3 / 743B) TaxID=573061 RepID=D9SMU8_CLOC7|nr:bifunctional (p)ppGpp synthetase/guanosine-3',5'-bis(diphosphate) 3'-pyrophosphohydrolase [Clostridium cellulovorans]ADL51814.1 (p)ppGpp synthetase I, SpoT/RelA [Clostridium cellulovorans 743B]
MLDKLLQIIDENNMNVNKELIEKAYFFTEKAHEGQKRLSGEAYFIHPVEVAKILTEMGMDTATIVAGLLHDVVEDTDFTYEDMVREFTKEVADLVDGVTKLDKIHYRTKEEAQADNIRKMLLAMTKDIRVILIKLADRLHNMRTIKFQSPDKQKEIAKETMDIYAPLAHRLGIFKIKWELEDLCLRYLHSTEYYDLVQKIASKRTERENDIREIIDELINNLGASNIHADIDGRPKHFYSIYKKMVNKNKSLDQIFDLMAVRILVKTIKDCYATLGIVHTMYKPIPGRFKDYIAMPKPNMYQSLHTTVFAKNGKPFEIQIRTFDMHKTAEFGIAAHWKYKEGGSSNDKDFDNKLGWIRDVIEYQTEEANAKEFMENFKVDLFSDEVFVFTPAGKVINLPYESTPIDFAYRIHTDVGNRCIGAKVNGKIIPLDYKLKTGEIVDVMTSSLPKGPSIDWLSTVKSNHARSKIREWFKKAKREEQISKGKELLERESKRQGHNFGELSKVLVLGNFLKKGAVGTIEDLYVLVGTGTLSPSIIVTKLVETLNPKVPENITVDEINETISKKNKNKKVCKTPPGVMVKGERDILVRFAQCCSPIPGDDILGYITKGRGVSIHRRDCLNLETLIQEDATRIVDVEWGIESTQDFIADMQVEAYDRTGLLNEVVMTISDTKTSLQGINARTQKNDVATINLKVKVCNVKQLHDLMKKLRKLKGVIDVHRTSG